MDSRVSETIDGASVLSPVYSQVADVEDGVYASIFDEEAPQEDPGKLSSSFRPIEDDSRWTTVLPSSSRVSAVDPEVWNPEHASNGNWMVPRDNDAAYPSGIGAGLENLGNTCFMNAIMQCFTHTVPFVTGLRSCTHSDPCESQTGFCVICAFRDHINGSLASSGRTLSPRKLVDNLSYFSSLFQGYRQEDAHEFMQCALDKLERCFLDLKKNNVNFEDDNLVEKVFGGRLISKLRCGNCGHTSETYEPLIDLSLEIENVDTLSRALESFTTVENIDCKFRCDSCNEEVSKEKQLMLDQTPFIAAFHLKRFKTDGTHVQKIDKHVDFPLELDLQHYTISDDNSDVRLKYNLYAVVVHEGVSSTSGHYFCFVRSAPDTWHKLDDLTVTKVSGDSVLSQEAYLLFYARQGTPWFSSIMVSPNTSPKSVLDIADNPCKSNPILVANTERGQAVDYSCQESSGFLEINDLFAAPLDDCKQFPVDKNNSRRQVDSGENDDFHPLTPSSSPSDAEKSFRISRDHLRMENRGSGKKPNKFAGDSERQAAMKYVNKMHGPKRDALIGLIALRDEASLGKKRKSMDSWPCHKGKSRRSSKR